MRSFFVYGHEILVDNEDFIKVIPFKYYVNYRNAVIKNKTKLDRYNSIHRLIMKCPDNMEVDHINGNPLDNRKCNLRICTIQENRRNKRKTKNLKSSRYKGVYFEKYTQKWRAEITVNYKPIKLGRFKIESSAAKAYNKAAKYYFGEFANLNNIKEKI